MAGLEIDHGPDPTSPTPLRNERSTMPSAIAGPRAAGAAASPACTPRARRSPPAQEQRVIAERRDRRRDRRVELLGRRARAASPAPPPRSFTPVLARPRSTSASIACTSVPNQLAVGPSSRAISACSNEITGHASVLSSRARPAAAAAAVPRLAAARLRRLVADLRRRLHADQPIEPSTIARRRASLPCFSCPRRPSSPVSKALAAAPPSRGLRAAPPAWRPPPVAPLASAVCRIRCWRGPASGLTIQIQRAGSTSTQRGARSTPSARAPPARPRPARSALHRAGRSSSSCRYRTEAAEVLAAPRACSPRRRVEHRVEVVESAVARAVARRVAHRGHHQQPARARRRHDASRTASA